MPEQEVTFEISPKLKAELRAQAEQSCYFFIKGILGFDWLVPHIHKPVCELLENSTRVRIVLPRGWLKSTICSIGYPLWRAIKNPNVRVLICQNTHTNACKKLASISAIVKTNPLFRALWPELLPDSSCKWSSEALQLKRSAPHAEATFEAAGTRTKVVSRHYDLIVEDDTVAPDLDEMGEHAIVPTKEDIEQAIGWHRLSLPLLVDPMTSQSVIVGTRWFEKDLLSWNAEHEKQYACIERRAIELGEGGVDEYPYPERFNAEVLEGIEQAMGPYLFSCLYLNEPVSPEDMTFKPEWISYYEVEPAHLITYTTVDLAPPPEESLGKDLDFNVVITCGKDLSSGRIYVLDYFRARCNPGKVIAEIFAQVMKWNPVKVGIEKVQYQKSLIYWIKERMRTENRWFLIEGITHGNRSKSSRIEGLQPVFASGSILLRHWMSELVNELLAYPLAAHDDLPDALSMQLTMWEMTKIQPRKKQEYEKNPLNAMDAIDEILSRKNQTPGFIFDALQPSLRRQLHDSLARSDEGNRGLVFLN